MGTMKWQPAWWNEHHASAWERVKEAMRRDWEQTKNDLHIKGGHELNQTVGATANQIAGKQEIPPPSQPNPPKVVGRWDDVEVPTAYGYAARDQYGKEHATWTSDLETKLRGEWEKARGTVGHGWDDVREHVRRGFESKR